VRPLPRPRRPDLDSPAFAEGDLPGALDRLVHCAAFDHVEAAQDLLRLCEGAVGHERSSGLEADATGLRLWPQALGVDDLAGELGPEAWTVARTRMTAASNAWTTRRPLVPVAPVTRIIESSSFFRCSTLHPAAAC